MTLEADIERLRKIKWECRKVPSTTCECDFCSLHRVIGAAEKWRAIEWAEFQGGRILDQGIDSLVSAYRNKEE